MFAVSFINMLKMRLEKVSKVKLIICASICQKGDCHTQMFNVDLNSQHNLNIIYPLPVCATLTWRNLSMFLSAPGWIIVTPSTTPIPIKLGHCVKRK